MECREIEELLSAYIEGKLAAVPRRAVDAHMLACPTCAGLRDSLIQLICDLPDLHEEVPFFLQNRLLQISERTERRRPHPFFFPKWVAATVGTLILFLNLFYFTNIFPLANRGLHSAVSKVEQLIAKTDGFLEKIKESKDMLLYTFFNKKPAEEKINEEKKGISLKAIEQGGKNG